jgi:G:T-mismatch repair DNA endonuclease (very short patch repair protein)
MIKRNKQGKFMKGSSPYNRKIYKIAKLISCACGCGKSLMSPKRKSNGSWIDIKYVHGHNGCKYNPCKEKKQKIILCACGCGNILSSLDNKKRNRKFIHGHFTEEFRQKCILRRRNQIFPMNDTKIEIKIQDYIKQLGVEFFTHQYMKIQHDYQTDIFIPIHNLIIECDGDYWHGNINKYPKLQQWQLDQIEEDRIRTKELQDKGFNVWRIWEHEINKMSLNDFKIKLNTFQKPTDAETVVTDE